MFEQSTVANGLRKDFNMESVDFNPVNNNASCLIRNASAKCSVSYICEISTQ